jgi:hypothetical protein
MIRLGEVLRTELEPVGKPPENRGQTESTPATDPTEPTQTATTKPEPEPLPTTETETAPSP